MTHISWALSAVIQSKKYVTAYWYHTLANFELNAVVSNQAYAWFMDKAHYKYLHFAINSNLLMQQYGVLVHSKTQFKPSTKLRMTCTSIRLKFQKNYFGCEFLLKKKLSRASSTARKSSVLHARWENSFTATKSPVRFYRSMSVTNRPYNCILNCL